MKSRFTTVDVVATVSEIAQSCIGLRVSNVYDLNNKTYLIKLSKPDHKVTLLFESGIRLHLTDFDWPKNITPSGFSMKLRKHIKNKRLERIDLVGIDRIVRLQFGTGEWTFYLIVELYDKGNALLTDHQFTIVHLLRPRTDATDQTKIVTSEKYQLEKARQSCDTWTLDAVNSAYNTAAPGDKKSGSSGGQHLGKVLTALFPYGGPLLDHCLRLATKDAVSLKSVQMANTSPEEVLAAFQLGEEIVAGLRDRPSETIRAFVTTKPRELSSVVAAAASTSDETKVPSGESGVQAAAASVDPYKAVDFLEFHPMELRQTQGKERMEFPSFNKAVDEFFLKMESQKLDQKALQQEKAALKKLDNIKQDHEKRLAELVEAQISDREKGELVQTNLAAVEKALLVINSALANQLDWDEIADLVASAKAQADPVASMIQELRLDRNAIVLRLSDPYDRESRVHSIEVDLGTSAYGNVKRLFDQKKQSAAKEEKTKQASEKALKAADRKTHEMLKEAQKVTSIAKLRKPMWFEKFYWFVSSENYLVIGGRDQQQNEFVVKRHLKAGDLYVHADLHGASSVVIKNPTGVPVPPKTLNEAGQMAVVYSGAWSAKVLSNAWWVHHHQVSKVAPTGEYLTTGSFMIRGKKNYLPSVQLAFGFGFMFRIDEESVPNHKGERAVAPYSADDEAAAAALLEAEFADAPDGGLPVLPEVLEFGRDPDDDNGGEPDVAVRYEYAADGKFEVARQTSAISATSSASVDETATQRRRVDSLASTASSRGRKVPAHERRAAKKLHQQPLRGPRLSNRDSLSGDLDENSQVGDLEGNSQVGDLEGNSQVGDLEGNSQVGDLEGNSQVGDLEGNSQIGDLEGNSQVGDLEGNSQSEDDDEAVERNSQTADREVGNYQESDNDLEENPKSCDDLERVSVKREALDPVDEPSSRIKTVFKDEPSVLTASAKGAAKNKLAGKQQKEQQQQQQQQQPKRGQRSKLKKMREKYKDQDDEDKRLAMNFLQSEGKKPDAKPLPMKKQKQQQQQQQPTQKHQQEQQRQPTVAASTAAAEPPDADDDDQLDAEEAGGATSGQDAVLLDSLTGQPLPDDILLFAIPVCAPLGALTSYKYKAKLTPGTSKRGKAGKTALAVFAADKACTRAERDLLKAVKDNELVCNLPGKVKLSLAGAAKQKLR